MIRNYLIVALRVFRVQPVYTSINILGLGLGIACCIVTFIFLKHELSFDTFHEKKDRVFKIVAEYHTDRGDVHHIARTSYPLAEAIQNDLPDLGKVLQIQGPYENEVSFTYQGNFRIFKEKRALYANENFFNLLSFKILKGADGTVLKKPGKVFLTERLASKYFNGDDPIGQTIRLQGDSTLAEVVGIIENPPSNNSLPFDLVVSYETFRKRFEDIHRNNWTMLWAGSTYIELSDAHNLTNAEEQLTGILPKYIDEEDAAKYHYRLMPVPKIHTSEEYGNNTYYTIPGMVIYVLIALAVLIMGTACLNFINLATAQAIKRAKEIGIRKTLGGNRNQLQVQFYLETLLIVVVASLIALTIAQLFLYAINNYLQQYTIFDLHLNFDVLLFLIPVVIAVTLLAGTYPALIISGYHPVEAIKSRITEFAGSGNYVFRKALVVVQFCFSMVLLVSMIIILSQMNYLNNTDMGFNRDNVIHLRLPSNLQKNPEIAGLKNELLRQSYVEQASLSFGPPIGGPSWNCSFRKLDDEYQDGLTGSVKFVDEHYLETWEIPVIHGNSLTSRLINDSTFHVMVNRKFLQKIGMTEQEAIGTRFEFNGNLYGVIDGITDDFNTHSLKVSLQPAILAYRPSFFSGIDIRLKGVALATVSGEIESVFRQFFPKAYFEVIYPEDEIQYAYAMEKFIFRVVLIFCCMSVIISVFGLYGLVAFMVSRNRKMIGVRKVFGASTWSILKLFSREYLILLVIAFVISCPFAYILGSNFLSSFVYSITLSPSYFLMAFLIVMLIAVLTVGWKTYQSATQNPAQSLRYE